MKTFEEPELDIMLLPGIDTFSVSNLDTEEDIGKWA